MNRLPHPPILPVALILATLALPGMPGASARAAELRTNAVAIASPPAWLTQRMVDKVTNRIQRVLEWDIRRVTVVWYTDEAAFEKAHGLGSGVLAFARRSDNTVHVGPRVNAGNFEPIFGHELVHTILFQKYHSAIPPWLDEGLANYLARQGKVDYPWLQRHGVSGGVGALVHPFSGYTPGPYAREEKIRYVYLASQALVEMIASRCDLSQLLQLSVGKKLESYLPTFCGIHDVESELRAWVATQARSSHEG